MAERRMFSKRIIGSARFLKMPLSSQALYFHLGMQADDDGVVEAYTVVQTTGAAEDDLRVLCSKGFVKILNEDLVAYITDWRENNKLRADRKIDSIYKSLLLQMAPDTEILEMKNRADRALRIDDIMGQPRDVPGTAQDRLVQDRLVQDRLVQDRLGEKEADKPQRPRFQKPTIEAIKIYCQERGNNVDAERFMSYYESNGWKVGRNPMKDWKAAIRTWEQREKKEAKEKTSNPWLEMLEEETNGQS